MFRNDPSNSSSFTRAPFTSTAVQDAYANQSYANFMSAQSNGRSSRIELAPPNTRLPAFTPRVGDLLPACSPLPPPSMGCLLLDSSFNNYMRIDVTTKLQILANPATTSINTTLVPSKYVPVVNANEIVKKFQADISALASKPNGTLDALKFLGNKGDVSHLMASAGKTECPLDINTPQPDFGGMVIHQMVKFAGTMSGVTAGAGLGYELCPAPHPVCAGVVISSTIIGGVVGEELAENVSQSMQRIGLSPPVTSAPDLDNDIVVPPASPSTSSACQVDKAFIITGGTEADREKKYVELRQSDSFHRYGKLDCLNKNEIAVVFSSKGIDLQGVTCEVAKRCAGTTELPPDFRTSTYGSEPRYGTVRLFSSRSAESLSPKYGEEIQLRKF